MITPKPETDTVVWKAFNRCFGCYVRKAHLMDPEYLEQGHYHVSTLLEDERHFANEKVFAKLSTARIAWMFDMGYPISLDNFGDVVHIYEIANGVVTEWRDYFATPLTRLDPDRVDRIEDGLVKFDALAQQLHPDAINRYIKEGTGTGIFAFLQRKNRTTNDLDTEVVDNRSKIKRATIQDTLMESKHGGLQEWRRRT